MNEAVEKELFPVEESDPETPEPETHPVEDSGDTDTDVDASEKPAVVEKEDPGVVPRELLIAERKKWQEKNDEIEKRLEQLQKKSNRVEQIEQAFAELHRRQEEAQKPPVPGFDEDPAANLDYRTRQMQEEFQRMQDRVGQTEAEYQRRAMLERAGRVIMASEQSVREEHADYDNALNYVRDRMAQLIKLEDPKKNEAEIQDMIYAIEMDAAIKNMNFGLNPAQIAYERAKIWGYSPQTLDNDSGDMEKLEKGVKKSKSLGSGTGVKKSLETMTDEEFDEVLSALTMANAGLIRQ